MRLFTAVELGAEVRAAAAAYSRGLRSRIEQAGLQFRARWIPEDNLHVTLTFLGEVADARLAAIAAALDAPLVTPRFVAVVAGAGVFPPSGAPRIVWLGIDEGSDAL